MRFETNDHNRVELMFILLFRYVRKLRTEQLQKLAKMTADKAARAGPILGK